MIVILDIINSITYKRISVDTRRCMNELQQGYANQLDETLEKILVCQDTLFFWRFSDVCLEVFLSVRVEITGGTILNVEQVEKVVRRNSQ